VLTNVRRIDEDRNHDKDVGKENYKRAEEIDVDEDVFAVVEVQLGSFEHDLTDRVGRRTEHHNYTRQHTNTLPDVIIAVIIVTVVTEMCYQRQVVVAMERDEL